MNNQTTRADYRDRIGRVLVHIRDHLDDDLDLDELADIACLSRFHWHRVYRAMIGETVWQTVHRLRLDRAAHDLVETGLPLNEIAVRAGYASRQSFSRAFGDSYGLSPLKYRSSDGTRQTSGHDSLEGRLPYDMRIETRPPIRIAGFIHTGSYRSINATFGKLSAELSTIGPVPRTAMAAVYLDDPDLVPEGELTSLAGVVLADGAKVPDSMTHSDLPGGRYAVLSHRGPYSQLQNAYDYLFGTWLKNSGETIRPVPAAEIYLNTPVDTPPKDLATEILLAIE